MYSKFEEMRVIRQVFQNYTAELKRDYEGYVAMLKDKSNEFPLDIDNDQAYKKIKTLQSTADSLSSHLMEYQNALKIIGELDKAIKCYTQAYSPEQLLSGGVAEQRAKEGNKIFYDIRTQNPVYKSIMSEIAYSLFVNHDSMIEDLGMDYDAKVESLEKNYAAGKISKEQLIYYTNMGWHLSQNPNYIEYMNKLQFEQEKQTIHK